jgi:hypothetical protein
MLALVTFGDIEPGLVDEDPTSPNAPPGLDPGALLKSIVPRFPNTNPPKPIALPTGATSGFSPSQVKGLVATAAAAGSGSSSSDGMSTTTKVALGVGGALAVGVLAALLVR